MLIIYTGGTVGMVPREPDNPASPLIPASKEELAPYVPDLDPLGIYWDIQGLLDENNDEVDPLDSSDVNAEHWKYMATAIEANYADWDGFIILHGTDTMAYTASGLSFMLNNLAKPVVITGSQLPISHPRSDAVQNLMNSMYVAGYKATELPLVPEVTICFGTVLLRGNRVRKMSATAWQGFETPNFPPLGRIGEHLDIDESLVLPPADNEAQPFYTVQGLATAVMDIGIFPGMHPAQLEKVMDGLDGLVLRTFGAGNAPGNDEFLAVIEKATKKTTILNVTQCPEGMVEMGQYEASSGLLERGVISGLDMTPEAALAKLMLTLENEVGDEVKQQLQISQRGEQSQNLFDLQYGPAGSEESPHEGVVKVTATPSGVWKARLVSASVRIFGLRFTDLGPGEEYELRVFVNMPNADEATPLTDPHFAHSFAGPYDGGPMNLIQAVTATVRQVAEEGRPINITLVPTKGKKFWYRALSVSLFARA